MEKNLFDGEDFLFKGENKFFSRRKAYFLRQKNTFSPEKRYFSPWKVFFSNKKKIFSLKSIYLHKKGFFSKKKGFSPSQKIIPKINKLTETRIVLENVENSDFEWNLVKSIHLEKLNQSPWSTNAATILVWRYCASATMSNGARTENNLCPMSRGKLFYSRFRLSDFWRKGKRLLPLSALWLESWGPRILTGRNFVQSRYIACVLLRPYERSNHAWQAFSWIQMVWHNHTW